MATKICTKCRRGKPLTAFARRKASPDGRQYRCRQCVKEMRPGKERDREYQARYYEKNRVVKLERTKSWRDGMRERIFDAYGRACACCGEMREEFLTLDHVGGRDEEHKGLGTYQVYARVVKEGFPAKYRLLCFNCNCAHGIYGYCPHERERHEEATG